MSERRTIRELESQPAAHLARCRALLVETAVALVVRSHVGGPLRDILVARLALPLPDLDAVIEGPIFAVRVAAWRVVRAHQNRGAWEQQTEAEDGLRYALHMLFAGRSDAALARFNGEDPDVIER